MTSTAYGIDTYENVAISGMQKLECHNNVEISPGMSRRRWWGTRNIQQLARIKPSPTLVGTQFIKMKCN